MLAIEGGYLDHIGDDEEWWVTHRDELNISGDEDEFDFGDDDSEEDTDDFDDIDDLDDEGGDKA